MSEWYWSPLGPNLWARRARAHGAKEGPRSKKPAATGGLAVGARSSDQRRPFAGAVGQLGWRWRVELTLFGVGWWGWSSAPGHVRWLVVVLAGAGLCRLERAARLRRRWRRSTLRAGLCEPNKGGGPYPVRRVRRVACGDVLDVELPPKASLDNMQKSAGVLANNMRAQAVKVKQGRHAGRATVTLVRRDPLAGTVELPWPLAATASASLWGPIPVGVDENGEPVTLTLPYRNLLLGGEPRSGKSTLLATLVAAAALDPTVTLDLLDGTEVDLTPWAGCARSFVGMDMAAAVDVLTEAHAELADRKEWLLDHGLRKLPQSSPFGLRVVAMDEMPFFFNPPDDPDAKQARWLATDLVARGPKFGVVFLGAAQRPSHDNIPTKLRALVGYRCAMRCADSTESDIILGAGKAKVGYDASTIGLDQRGVGWLLGAGEVPVRMRGYYLSDADVDALAARAVALRSITVGISSARKSEVGPPAATIRLVACAEVEAA